MITRMKFALLMHYNNKMKKNNISPKLEISIPSNTRWRCCVWSRRAFFITELYPCCTCILKTKEFSLVNVNWLLFNSNKLSLNTLKSLNETPLYYSKEVGVGHWSINYYPLKIASFWFSGKKTVSHFSSLAKAKCILAQFQDKNNIVSIAEAKRLVRCSLKFLIYPILPWNFRKKCTERFDSVFTLPVTNYSDYWK